MATKLIRFGKDVDPSKWDEAFKKKVAEAGDEQLYSKAIVNKCWSQGLKEICEAGSAMELSIDTAKFTWTIVPRTPKAKELVKKTKPEIMNRQGRSSGKAAIEVPEGPSAKVEKTLKFLDAAGNLKDFVCFVVAVPTIGLNPLALLAEGWKVLDTAVGMGIGLAKNREAWGVEISKSALTRLADYATEKLMEQRMMALKAAAGDNLKARALYVANLEKELLKLQTQHAEFRQREEELTSQMQELSVAAHKWDAMLEKEARELLKVFAAGVTPEQYSKINNAAAKIIASHKELAKFRAAYIGGMANDLWKRGAPTINQAAVSISALKKEIETAKTTDWFAKRVSEGTKGSGKTPDVEDSTDPAQAKEVADLMLALTGEINIWDVGGNVQLLLNTVAGVYNIQESVKRFRTDTNKWRTERKSVWQVMETSWNLWTISKMPKTEVEKKKWKLAALPEIEKMEKEAGELKRKQASMESVVLAHNENIQKAYQEAVAGMDNARKAYERQVQVTKKQLDKAQTVMKNPRFVDKQRKKELQSIVGQIQNKRNQLKQRLDEKAAELKKVEEMALQENKYCQDVLNEGHEQDINKRAVEIERLKNQLATVG